MKDIAILILRLGLGIIFMAHGLQKGFGMFGGSGIDGFTQMLAGLGFSPAAVWALVAAQIELIGGVFLIFGVLTRITSIFLFILISIAAVKVHLAHGFFLAEGGFEYALIIACICVALVLLGSGKFSLVRKL